ncbi:SDR family oxidoreductase [Rhodococcus sp. D2-41]|uniref:SDR family oxidoreductase n=1 Tax=Speluncibacter jeojiensis TaxID=2710754 RepID=UPI00240EF465|nr:SDR family oxidoreductase [Rhodococcus sp. D2-41]MDG3010112.1 SDR family oxidoreductase [Rhodococcus sp. D2-41]
MSPSDSRDRAVLITGAASGIGRATALAFARAGYLVGGYDIDEPGLVSLRREIDSAGGLAVTGFLDVTDAPAWHERLAEFTAAAGGRLDVLVNNAGVLSAGRFEDMTPLDHQRMVEINVLGAVNGCYTAFPYLRDTPGAQVVNLCSASAIYGQPELATYGATKFAVRGLTEALDLEWRRDDIRVVAVWPLFVDTGMLHDVTTASTASLGVRLTADDVAAEILAVVRGPRRRLPRVHYPVGRQARAMFASAQFAPGWVLREINRRINRS